MVAIEPRGPRFFTFIGGDAFARARVRGGSCRCDSFSLSWLFGCADGGEPGGGEGCLSTVVVVVAPGIIGGGAPGFTGLPGWIIAPCAASHSACNVAWSSYADVGHVNAAASSSS